MNWQSAAVAVIDMNKTKHNVRRAFSLIEVMVALVIFMVASVVFLTALIFGGRTSYLAAQEVAATNFAMNLIEQMRTRTTGANSLTNYNNLGNPAASQTDSFIGQHTRPIVPGEPGGLVFTATVEFKGFGQVQSSTNNTLKAVIPNGFPQWQPGEWVGSVVMLTDGKGSGQIAYITANTADTLTITRDLSGATSLGWLSNPDSTTQFAINGGKTVVITVTWPFKGKTYSKRFETLLYLEN
ncbi:MAG: hypothetical protein Kow0059_05520 [Candidatus Sumerlaeia bacterium]